ncbi:MAG: hypothetical protein WKG32_14445 [Gemmatimonadaceae bacterium]
MTRTIFVPRRRRDALASAAAVIIAALALSLPSVSLRAQALVPGGDFDICDYCGTLRGNTAFLVGRAGFGTTKGEFVLVNAATSDQDVDHDGYTPGIDFNRLYVSRIDDFTNIADPAQVIRGTNLALQDVPRPLRNGNQNTVGFIINIPSATPAGRYRGSITVQDSSLSIGLGPNGEALRVDRVFVEIEVLPNSSLGLVQADTAARATSLVLRGRPGQTVSGVVRIANLGNVPLADVRLEATDLVATSGTGLRIRGPGILFSPSARSSIAIGDTSRIAVSVRIPTGLLAGSYTGALIVQAEGLGTQQIPLTVIVTTPGDIVFETNPVVGRQGDNAVIIFNGDPGSSYQIRIFDMMGLTVYASPAGLSVFAGAQGSGDQEIAPADLAVRFNWPLVNGRGEQVAGGMYYVIVDVLQDGRRRQLRNKLMVIR